MWQVEVRLRNDVSIIKMRPWCPVEVQALLYWIVMVGLVGHCLIEAVLTDCWLNKIIFLKTFRWKWLTVLQSFVRGNQKSVSPALIEQQGFSFGNLEGADSVHFFCLCHFLAQYWCHWLHTDYLFFVLLCDAHGRWRLSSIYFFTFFLILIREAFYLHYLQLIVLYLSLIHIWRCRRRG